MAELSAGHASMPARIAAAVPDREGLLAAMPAYLPSIGLGAKLVSVFPQNAGTAEPTHHAVVLVFDASTGKPVAMLDGESITAARTAACSALSTELLARDDARVLAILGSGVQARAHALAVSRVRPFAQIRVASRNKDHADRLVAELAPRLALEVISVSGFADACNRADVISATTHAVEPVVRRDYLAPGVHVTSVGYNTAGREVDSQTVVDALLVVESRAAVLAPPPSGSPDIRIPIEEGLIGPEHIHAEIGEIVSGTKPGRTSPDQITLYKSVGVAVQDVAAAAIVLAAARSKRLGTQVEM